MMSWSSQHTCPASKLAMTSACDRPRWPWQAPGLQKQPVRSMMPASAASFSTSLQGSPQRAAFGDTALRVAPSYAAKLVHGLLTAPQRLPP